MNKLQVQGFFIPILKFLDFHYQSMLFFWLLAGGSN